MQSLVGAGQPFGGTERPSGTDTTDISASDTALVCVQGHVQASVGHLPLPSPSLAASFPFAVNDLQAQLAATAAAASLRASLSQPSLKATATQVGAWSQQAVASAPVTSQEVRSQPLSLLRRPQAVWLVRPDPAEHAVHGAAAAPAAAGRARALVRRLLHCWHRKGLRHGNPHSAVAYTMSAVLCACDIVRC